MTRFSPDGFPLVNSQNCIHSDYDQTKCYWFMTKFYSVGLSHSLCPATLRFPAALCTLQSPSKHRQKAPSARGPLLCPPIISECLWADTALRTDYTKVWSSSYLGQLPSSVWKPAEGGREEERSVSRTSSGLWPGPGTCALFQKALATNKSWKVSRARDSVSYLLLILISGFGATRLGLKGLWQFMAHILLLSSFWVLCGTCLS